MKYLIQKSKSVCLSDPTPTHEWYVTIDRQFCSSPDQLIFSNRLCTLALEGGRLLRNLTARGNNDQQSRFDDNSVQHLG